MELRADCAGGSDGSQGSADQFFYQTVTFDPAVCVERMPLLAKLILPTRQHVERRDLSKLEVSQDALPARPRGRFCTLSPAYRFVANASPQEKTQQLLTTIRHSSQYSYVMGAFVLFGRA
jgi:hypothetical protein